MRSTTSRCRSTATGCSDATGCTSPTTRPRSSSSSATARPARRTTWPAGPSGPTARSSSCCWRSSASRGRWSGRSRIDPATIGATPWTAPGWRRSAGGRAMAFEDGLAATVDWFRANEPWWRAARSGDWDGWYDAPVQPPAGDRPGGGRDASRRPRPSRRRLMRVAVTGANGRLGRALVAALADAPFTGPAGPIAWDRAAFDLDAPETASGAPRRGIGPRSSSTRRRGATSTAAPWIPSSRGGGTASRPASWPRPAPPRRSTSSRSRRTRSSTACATTAGAMDRTIRPRPAIRTARPSSKASGWRPRPTDEPGCRQPRDRPDGVAVRSAGPRLPEPDPRRGGTGVGRGRAAAGRGGRVGNADLRPRPRRGDRRAPRGGRRRRRSITS